MKATRLLFVKLMLAAMMLPGVKQGQAQECGSVPPPEYYNFMLERVQTLSGIGVEALQPEALPVQFIISRNSSGGNAALTPAQIAVTMSEINAAYAPMNMSFYEQGSPLYLDSDSWNSSFNKIFDFLLPLYEVDNVINIFVFPSVISGSSSICGYALFPDGSNSRVVLTASCTQNGSTTAHELGHYFSLLHTHETFYGSELVARTNCTTAGDLFCDTPADPDISSLVSSACVYTGTATDANGDPYTPDPNNIMSYSVKACRTNFSDEQKAAIVQSMYNDRAYLIQTTDIIAFPHVESFEDGLGKWSNVSGDNLDWTRDAGGTPSSGTGPATGSEGNYYMYIESSTSGTGFPSKVALLQSPVIHLGSLNNPALEFSYHMYGSTMGTLEVQVSTNGGGSWSNLWSENGDQGNTWHETELSLQSYAGQDIMLRFRGTTGTSFTSDMAIDYIRINTSGSSCTAGITTFPYTESFESGLGNWNNAAADHIDWTRDSGGTPSSGTGPTTGSDGSFYLFTESSTSGTGYPNKRAVLISNCIDLNGLSNPLLEFDYHMYGATMGSLELLISDNNGITWTSLWSESGDQGNSWFTGGINLAAYNDEIVLLQFLATTGSNFTSDMAIDNIRISNDSPDEGDEVAAIQRIDEGDYELSVFPNPVNSPLVNIHLNAMGSATARVELLSLSGHTVFYRTYATSPGENLFQLDVSGLATGMYQVAVVFDDGGMKVSKLLVQH